MEIGEKHNMLTCISKDERRDKRYYIFKCDCGNEKSIIAYNVKSGATKCCGCVNWKQNYKHGLAHTRIDNIYKAMVSRCYKTTNNRYSVYGQKGVEVCKEWLEDKKKFFEWSFANGYKDNLTIDRIDVNGNYEPSNCRWATIEEQANNRTTNTFIEYKGERHTLSEWSKITGINMGTLSSRIKRGYVGDSIFLPVPIIRTKKH